MEMYLIQRGRIRKGVVDTLTKSVNLDYMGSSEFEWGALPKSLRYVRSNFDKYRKALSKRVINTARQQLIIFHPFEDEAEFDQYVELLIKLSQGKQRLQEFTGFESYFSTSQTSYTNFLRGFDFWWDIENHVFFTFDHKFAKKFIDILQNSFKVMT